MARPTLACSSWGQVIDHVAPLVLLAPLDQRPRSEDLDNALAQRLATVDHPQARALGIQAALDELAEQRAHHTRALGGALAQPQHVLVALRIDAQRHQDHPLLEVDAVDHHHWQIQLVQRARQPLLQLLLAQRHEAARGRAPRHRAGRFRRWQRLERADVAAYRGTRGDRGHRRFIQRVSPAGPGKAWQFQLARMHRTRPRSPHTDALAAQHYAAARAASAQCTPIGIGHALGTAQGDPVGFHHRRQHLLAGGDAQPIERVLDVPQHALDRQRQLHLRSRNNLRRGFHARLHLGGSFGLLARQPAWSHMRDKGAATSAHSINTLRDITQLVAVL
jgi:hypothetical protein